MRRQFETLRRNLANQRAAQQLIQRERRERASHHPLFLSGDLVSRRRVNSGVRCLLLRSEMYKGKQGHYFWLGRALDTQDTSRLLAHLLKACPDVVLGNFVIVTCLDSGALQLTPQQVSEGWRQEGRLAISPKIKDASELDFNWFDEWYIFDELARPTNVEVFVNYGTFSLGDPRPTIATMYIGTDKEKVAQMVEGALELQQKFWAQIERIKPKSFIANGNSFTFVTKDSDLFDKVVEELELL